MEAPGEASRGGQGGGRGLGDDAVPWELPKGKVIIASRLWEGVLSRKAPEGDLRQEGILGGYTLSRGSWKRKGPKKEAHDLRVQVLRCFLGESVLD